MILKQLAKLGLAFLAPVVFFSFTLNNPTPSEGTSLKCMLQMTNYKGEGAYIIVSLINPQGNYDETLYIFGDDPEWYHEIESWWGYFGQEEREVDGITGATLSGGDRKVVVFTIDHAKIDQGYKLRFETSVEDQNYYPIDLEIPLKSENLKTKEKGEGYIRYVRLMPN